MCGSRLPSTHCSYHGLIDSACTWSCCVMLCTATVDTMTPPSSHLPNDGWPPDPSLPVPASKLLREGFAQNPSVASTRQRISSYHHQPQPWHSALVMRRTFLKAKIKSSWRASRACLHCNPAWPAFLKVHTSNQCAVFFCVIVHRLLSSCLVVFLLLIIVLVSSKKTSSSFGLSLCLSWSFPFLQMNLFFMIQRVWTFTDTDFY